MDPDLVLFNEWNVGDKVVVVDKPYTGCPFTWVGSMNRYCSKETVIVSKKFSAIRRTYSYRIEADDSEFMWCGNCFIAKQAELQEEEADFDMEEDLFEKLILG